MARAKTATGGLPEALGTPSDEPVAIEHVRYRNKAAGYVVVVLEVHHHPATERGYHSMVVVRGSRTSKDKRVVWPAKVFLRQFEPIGRKVRLRSSWERLKKA